MNNRRKRNVLIVGLGCLLVFMSVGYAILSQVLNINGTAILTGNWEIFIDSITVKETKGSAKSNNAEVSNDKLGANFDVDLNKPGDFVEYEVVVKNEGTINAVLRELIPNIESNNMDIIFTHSMIQGQILKAESETIFTLKIRFDERATEITSGGKTSFDIRLIYEQYDGNTNEIDSSLIPVTANDCFDISVDGEILNYDYSCGTYVTIPAVVNGIDVEKINSGAFKEANAVLYFDQEEIPRFLVARDDVAYERGLQMKEAMGEAAANIGVYKISDITIPDSEGMVKQVLNITDTLELDFLDDVSSRVEYLDLSQAISLKKIGSKAFASSKQEQNLKHLNLDGVKFEDLSSDIFNYSNLESLTIDSDLFNEKIYNFGSMSLDTLRILKGETTSEITKEMKYGGTINKLIIGEGITKITTMFDSRNITDLQLPSTLTYIGDRVFYGNQISIINTSIGDVISIPNSINYIGEYAFANALQATTLYIYGNGSTTIDTSAFSSNSSLYEVRITDVETIGEKAFSEFSTSESNNIKLLYLSDVKNIGKEAFAYNKINIAATATFASSINLKATETIGENAFYGNYLGKVGSVHPVVLCSIKTLGGNAFGGNNGRLYIYTNDSNLLYNGSAPTALGTSVGDNMYVLEPGRCK